MNFADPITSDLEQSRTRILEVAERYFRRIGYHKTSVADIALELGMSRANIYRFFPSKTAINSSVCGLVVKEVAEIALEIARSDAPASKKLADLLTAIHRHSARTLVEDRPMHQLLVAATDGSWATLNAHNEHILATSKRLSVRGSKQASSKSETPTKRRMASSPPSCRFPIRFWSNSAFRRVRPPPSALMPKSASS